VLQLVRIAPAAAGESASLQQVFYRVTDGTLLRQATPAAATVTTALETIDADTLSTVRLLSAVKSLRVREWRDGSGWIDSGWVNQSSSEAAPPPVGAAPQWQATPGLEILLERTDGHVFRRVLLVG